MCTSLFCLLTRLRSLAGEYNDAFGFLEESRRIEEEELGARPDRMADLLYALADTKSEVSGGLFLVVGNGWKN